MTNDVSQVCQHAEHAQRKSERCRAHQDSIYASIDSRASISIYATIRRASRHQQLGNLRTPGPQKHLASSSTTKASERAFHLQLKPALLHAKTSSIFDRRSTCVPILFITAESPRLHIQFYARLPTPSRAANPAPHISLHALIFGRHMHKATSSVGTTPALAFILA